jgi:hypothetical protein
MPVSQVIFGLGDRKGDVKFGRKRKMFVPQWMHFPPPSFFCLPPLSDLIRTKLFTLSFTGSLLVLRQHQRSNHPPDRGDVASRRSLFFSRVRTQLWDS